MTQEKSLREKVLALIRDFPRKSPLDEIFAEIRKEIERRKRDKLT